MYPGERVKVSHGGPLHTENLGPGMETDCVIADPKLRGEQQPATGAENCMSSYRSKSSGKKCPGSWPGVFKTLPGENQRPQ